MPAIIPKLSCSLCQALTGYSKESPLAALAFISPLAEKALSDSAGISQQLTVAEHTNFVLQAARRYNLASGIPYISQEGKHLFGPREFLLLLMTHDLNKNGQKGEKKDSAAEHTRTVEFLLLSEHHRALTITEQQLSIVCALIKQDIIGDYFRAHVPQSFMLQERINLYRRYNPNCAESLQDFLETHREIVSQIAPQAKRIKQDALTTAYQAIQSLSDTTQIPPQQVFEILLRFFLADTLAYTCEANQGEKRGGPWLDFFYEINQPSLTPTAFRVIPQESRVRFSPPYENLYQHLRGCFFNNQDSLRTATLELFSLQTSLRSA